MEAICKEIIELKQKRIIEEGQFKTRINMIPVMEELKRHSFKNRIKPSNIKSYTEYGSIYYNWLLKYIGY